MINLDPKFALAHKSVLMLIAILVIIGLFIAFWPIKGLNVVKSDLLSLVSLSLSLLLVFPFANEFYKGFNPIANLDENARVNVTQKEIFFKKLDNFYKKEMKAVFKGNGVKRNLIIMDVESMEKGTMGDFNLKYKKQMPFMSKLYHNSTSVEYIPSSLYTDWSVASMFASQCNLPLMVSNPGAQGFFHLYNGHRCLGDFLSLLGYTLISVETGVFVGDYAKQLRGHKWKVYDRHEHRSMKDTDTFKFINEKIFPTIKEPFVLFISNTDTHHWPRFTVDRRCAQRVTNDYPILLKSFDCFDQVFEKFFNDFQKSKFANNTEFIIYNDHLLLPSVKDLGFENRSLTVMIPTRPKKMISKKATIYDIGPTFLDLIGVEIDPPFIFGESLLSNKIGMGVNATFVKYLYEYFNNKFKFDGELKDYTFNNRGIKFNLNQTALKK